MDYEIDMYLILKGLFVRWVFVKMRNVKWNGKGKGMENGKFCVVIYILGRCKISYNNKSLCKLFIIEKMIMF